MSANFLKILFSILIAISECYGINKVAYRDSLYKPILITSDFSHKLVGQEDSIYFLEHLSPYFDLEQIKKYNIKLYELYFDKQYEINLDELEEKDYLFNTELDPFSS